MTHTNPEEGPKPHILDDLIRGMDPEEQYELIGNVDAILLQAAKLANKNVPLADRKFAEGRILQALVRCDELFQASNIKDGAERYERLFDLAGIRVDITVTVPERYEPVESKGFASNAIHGMIDEMRAQMRDGTYGRKDENKQ